MLHKQQTKCGHAGQGKASKPLTAKSLGQCERRLFSFAQRCSAEQIHNEKGKEHRAASA